MADNKDCADCLGFSREIVFRNESRNLQKGTFSERSIAFQMPPKKSKPKPELQKQFSIAASLILRDLWKIFNGKMAILEI
jgi:hypothetical protein